MLVKKEWIKTKGFTLIELMIAMMLGLIVIGGALSIYISTIKSSSEVVKSSRLNYDLDSAMQLMANDLRRAGYWGGAIAGSDATSNPFTQGDANIQVSQKTGEANNSCILYSYDGESESDNVTGTIDDGSVGNAKGEYYGFRLNDGQIDIRYQATNANKTCNDPSWEVLTDSNKVNVSVLTFSKINSQCLNVTAGTVYTGVGAPLDMSCPLAATVGFSLVGDQLVETRQIDIILKGNVINDDTVKKALINTIKVRNNRIFTQL